MQYLRALPLLYFPASPYQLELLLPLQMRIKLASRNKGMIVRVVYKIAAESPYPS